MKTTKKLLLKTLLLSTIILGINSCTPKSSFNNQDAMSSAQRVNRRTQTQTCTTIECMQEYAAANTDIFGEQVFIFNTLDEAYDYLESLADSELNEKTAMYEASGVNCPIINSLIYWETGEELCGINNTEPNNITTTQIEEFEQYLSLQPDMYQETQIDLSEHEFFVDETQYTPGSEPLNYVTTYVKPLGGYDLCALLNEENVFIAEGCAYTKRGGYLYHLPIEEYFQAYTWDEEYLSNLIDELQDLNLDAGKIRILPGLEDMVTPSYGSQEHRYLKFYNGFSIYVALDFEYNRWWFFGRFTTRKHKIKIQNAIKKGDKTYEFIDLYSIVRCHYTMHDDLGQYVFNFPTIQKKISDRTFYYKYDDVSGWLYGDYSSNVHLEATNGYVSIIPNN